MDGLIIINKENNMTSHDVVNRIRKIMKTKRVGHFGTLDPAATGVLVICLNEATKLGQFLEYDSKTYQARILLGKETDTLDMMGNIIEEKEVDELDNDEVDRVINSFLGKSRQIPPIYSAIKVKGKKLYEYARNNQEVKIEPRDIEIYEIKRTSEIVINNHQAEFDIIVKVSKGTYIRSLAKDLANKLGYPGLLKSLVRTRSGIFDISEAYTIKDVEDGNYKIIPILLAINDYHKLDDEDSINKARNGMKISFNKVKETFGEVPFKVAVVNKDKLVAIYALDEENMCYKVVRGWN